MDDALTARLGGQCKLKRRCCGLHCQTHLLCIVRATSLLTISRTPPVRFWSARHPADSECLQNLEKHLGCGKPVTNAPEFLPTAVRIQQWTKVFCCHVRRAPCGTSSGACEIPQEPFLIKLDGTIRLVLHCLAAHTVQKGRLRRVACSVASSPGSIGSLGTNRLRAGSRNNIRWRSTAPLTFRRRPWPPFSSTTPLAQPVARKSQSHVHPKSCGDCAPSDGRHQNNTDLFAQNLNPARQPSADGHPCGSTATHPDPGPSRLL